MKPLPVNFSYKCNMMTSLGVRISKEIAVSMDVDYNEKIRKSSKRFEVLEIASLKLVRENNCVKESNCIATCLHPAPTPANN